MQIKTARFVVSSTEVSKCPKPLMPEYAFIGRSNVGKSSLINALTSQKNLAKTSSTPGKTQLINHFLINESWYLVDLPGLGYAKTSKTIRSKFEKMLNDYLLKRKNLMSVFVLIDSRIPPQTIDLELIHKMGENSIPFVCAFTKIDALTKNQLEKQIDAYKNILSQTWEILPQFFLSSSKTRKGINEMLTYINDTNLFFEK